MNWICLPVRRFCQLAPCLGRPETVAAVLVSSRAIDETCLRGIPHICMHFSDLTNPRAADVITARSARQIADFLDGLPAQVRTVCFCCDRGESRSAALAAAWLRAGGASERSVWDDPAFHPNILVFQRMCEAWGVPVGKLAAAIRVRRSRRALKRCVRNARRGRRNRRLEKLRSRMYSIEDLQRDADPA